MDRPLEKNSPENNQLSTIKWILLVSLLVNAAFAGFAFSRVTSHFGFGPPPHVMRHMAPPREVSEQTRAVLDKVFASEQGEMEETAKAWIAARRKTVQVLRAESLDRAALDAALADMRARTVAAQEVYHRVVAQAAPELNAEERVLLARILTAGPNRFGSNAVLEGPGGPRFGPGGGAGRSGDARMMPPPEDRAGAPEMMGPPPPPRP